MKTSLARVLKLALQHKKTLLIGFVALTLGSAINLLFPYLIRQILNGELGLDLERDINRIAMLLIFLFLVQASFFYLRHFCFSAAGYRIVAELRRSVFNALMRQDIAFFDRRQSGDLLSALTSDTEHVQRAVTINISVALRYFLQVVGGTILMFVISPRLALVMLVILPVCILISFAWGRKLRGLSKKMQTELGGANSIAEEALGAMRTVSIFAGADYETKRYKSAIDQSLETGISRCHTAAMFSSTMVFLMHGGIVCALWYGSTLVFSGNITIGDLTAFALYCVIVAVSFGFLANVWDEFMKAVGASERLFEILDSEPKITSPLAKKEPVISESDGNKTLAFSKVSFSYPTRTQVSALDDISFEVKEGETIALVGPSGAGKSTIAALIPRFYDACSGKILYKGIPLTDWSLRQLRSRISMVSQEPQIFSVSIRDNISYGDQDSSRERIETAAKAANVHEFACKLPQGYDTIAGSRGILLSAGQRQRIAIARAILKDPELLILDEATSNLDSENEQAVQQAINHLMHGRTTLIIAHRLSTVQHADKVLVIKDGRIFQEGTHSSLMQVSGLYQNLVEHQLL